MLIVILFAVMLVGCSSTPTAPTPIAPIINNVPPVSTPAPSPTPSPAPTPAPTRNPLLDDPRFSLSFYRQLALNGFEAPTQLQPLRRQREAPRIYLRTVMDNGTSIDPRTLDLTAAALINTAGSLTGVFGLAGLEQGTGNRLGEPGWITVEWLAAADTRACGSAVVGGDFVRLYPNTPGCRCAGGPAVKPAVIKHELGHALGFWHTDSGSDLMGAFRSDPCDINPSDREVFHARVAYSQPLGSRDPM